MDKLDLNQNILGIHNPQDYECVPYSYFPDHSMFWFRINHVARPDNYREALYVRFLSVKYFEGPMGWGGVDFQIAPEEEKWMLVRSITQEPDGIENLPQRFHATKEEIDRFYQNFNLYKLKTFSGLEVKIFALGIDKYSWMELPDHFFPKQKHPEKS